ncbi:MAG: hypothetical protein MI723_10675, partial [Caulobacterales bacterium]|nr:hypothetical protein [Caulobacterales bacterium]
RAGERLFVGASYRLSGVSEDMWLARYDRAGAMVWDDYPRVAGDDRLQALTASPAGDLFAAGTIRDDEFSISDVFVRMAFNAAVAALSDPAAASESEMEPPVVPPLRGTGAQARGADGETAPVAGDPSDVDESGAPAIEIAEAGVGGEVEDGVSSPASVDAAGEEAPTASSPRAVAAPAPIADAADIAPDDDRGERDVREPVSSAGEPVPETPPQEVAAAPAPAPVAPSAPADPPISADVSSRAPVEAPVASVEPAEPPRAAAGRERPRSGALSTAFNCSFACQSRADPGVTFPLEQFFVDQPPADERTFAQSIQSDMINACAAVGGVGDAATMPVCARAQTYTCVLDCVSDADPEVRFPLNQTYVDPSPLSPERFADRVKDEMMALCAVAGGVASPADVPICESDR